MALTFQQANAVDPGAFPMICADCVSCLHALEHFGLERYVDLDAWRIGFRNLARIVKLGGSLLLAVPVEGERIEFSAHRVFDPDRMLREAASLGLSLESYSFVDNSNLFHESVDLAASTSLDYGCGCLHFIQRRGTDHSTA